jgi:uncharacterized protein
VAGGAGALAGLDLPLRVAEAVPSGRRQVADQYRRALIEIAHLLGFCNPSMPFSPAPGLTAAGTLLPSAATPLDLAGHPGAGYIASLFTTEGSTMQHYHLAVRQLERSLKNLDAVLDKATKHAEARKFDVNNFLSMRLFPDMLPFVAQIRIACDSAKSTAANLAGKEAPRHEDTETTMEELRARIAKVLAYLATFTAADFERTTPNTLMKIPNPPGKALGADEYLFGRQIPNFYFHVTTAYDLLRHGGVELSKRDYLGPLNLVDA